MPVFEQDWLELGNRVARSLHYQHPRNIWLLQAAQTERREDGAGRPGVDPVPGDDQRPSAHGKAAHDT